MIKRFLIPILLLLLASSSLEARDKERDQTAAGSGETTQTTELDRLAAKTRRAYNKAEGMCQCGLISPKVDPVDYSQFDRKTQKAIQRYRDAWFEEYGARGY